MDSASADTAEQQGSYQSGSDAEPAARRDVADSLHERLSDDGIKAVDLPYTERLCVSRAGHAKPFDCEVRASEDISEDRCRAALTMFLVASCDNPGPLARRAVAHMTKWDEHTTVLVGSPAAGQQTDSSQQVSDLVAQLHERGALRIALVLADDHIASGCAWNHAALHDVRGVVSVATLGVCIFSGSWHELPSVPTLHVLPPRVVAPEAWTCDAAQVQPTKGLRRMLCRHPASSDTTMKQLPPRAELWEVEPSSLGAAVLAAAAAWIERSLRRETLLFSGGNCKLVLTADARLDEGMLYIDDPFDDLSLDDDSTDDDSPVGCTADSCHSDSGDTSSAPVLDVTDTLVQQDTTGSTFCWPAAFALCNFLLDHREWVRGKKVLEIGAGLGLPGICCAHAMQAAAVLLTDGSSAAVSRLSDNVACNPCPGTSIKTAQVQWSEATGRALVQSFAPEVVIASDLAYPFKDNTSLLNMFEGLLHNDCDGVDGNADCDATTPGGRRKILLGYGWRDLKAGRLFVARLQAQFSVVELCKVNPPTKAGSDDANVAVSVFVITKSTGVLQASKGHSV